MRAKLATKFPATNRRLALETLESRRLLAAEVTINEFLARNDGGLRDGDGRSSDWIEIYNSGDEAVDLSGYRLTDDPEDLAKWTFPSVSFGPGDYLLVFASARSDREFTDEDGNVHANFALNGDGEYLALVAPDGTVVSEYGPDGTDYPPQLSNVSYGVGQSFALVETTSDASYLVPLSGSLGMDWTQPEFDEVAGGFLPGKSAIGFETKPGDRVNFTGLIQTTLPDLTHAVYARMEFTINDASALTDLLLRLKYDNGFVAYLNGVPVASANAPATLGWFSAAPDSSPRDSRAVEFVDFDLSGSIDALVDGTNVLALHGLNSFSDNSDMLLVAELHAAASDMLAAIGTQAKTGYMATPTPGEPNVGSDGVFSGFIEEPRIGLRGGFYDTPQQVGITSTTEGADVYFTTDGSEPSPTNPAAELYSQPLAIAKTTPLRAAAWKLDHIPSQSDTQTYIFLEDVLVQSPDGEAVPGWPTRAVKGQAFDYGMDPVIVNDGVWGPQLVDALTQIPSVSLVTDIVNLVDTSTGIYVNAQQDGRQWERPTSIELLNPDGGEGFQIDAGLRIRGGFSRGGFNPKHAFRLFFRDQYGDGSLNFPLFGDEGVDTFTAVDLRTAQNYAWSNDTFNDQTRNTFLRDAFSRDLQREQGRLYTRSRYYHLYINGQYWGLYQTEERPEATLAASYLGGDENNYDVVKASGGTLEATDGSLDKWYELWEIAQAGFDTLAEYFLIQGRNADGSDNPDLEVHVDIDALIDFTLNFVYTGNSDMPTSLGSGTVANNYFAIRDRTSRDGWYFIAHDNEHNMLSLSENQTRDDVAGQQRSSFNPKYLHQQLDELPEYQLRFADRVQKFFFNDGPMTVERATAQLDSRFAQIDQAIIAESARWGDQHNEPPLTKKTWLAEVDWLRNTFLARRTETVLSQLRRKGLFPDTAAPSFQPHGGQVDNDFKLAISAPAGTVYYTLDETDPRLPGGAIGPGAFPLSLGGTVTLTRDTIVKARVLDGTAWSPLSEAQFLVGPASDATSLRVAELHYNPADPTPEEEVAGQTDNNAFEFIEFVNISDDTIDLAGAQLVKVVVDGEEQGVQFDFADGAITRLGPGQRVLVVEDLAAFGVRYGETLPVAGQWTGRLSNGGETVTLRVGDVNVQQFTYDDAWYSQTDGWGRSLVIMDAGDPDLSRWARKSGWRPSGVIGGTPGEASSKPGDANMDGVFNAADIVLVRQAGRYNDGIDHNSTFAEGDWNGDGDFDRFDLVFALQFGVFDAEA